MAGAPDEPSWDELQAALVRAQRSTLPPEEPAVTADDTLAPVPSSTQPGSPPGLGRALAQARGEQTDPEARVPLDEEHPFALEVQVAGQPAGWVRLGPRQVTVGRHMGALRLDDEHVSEGHALLWVRQGRLVLADGGAPSGVYIAAPPRLVIGPATYFACGQQVFRYLGPLEAGPWPDVYGAPLPRDAHRAEHVLVGNRSGQVVVFKSSLIVGKSHGQFRFPADESVAPVHAELRPGPEGMELVTHARTMATFVRIAPEREVPVVAGTVLRVGSATLTVVGRNSATTVV